MFVSSSVCFWMLRSPSEKVRLNFIVKFHLFVFLCVKDVADASKKTMFRWTLHGLGWNSHQQHASNHVASRQPGKRADLLLVKHRYTFTSAFLYWVSTNCDLANRYNVSNLKCLGPHAYAYINSSSDSDHCRPGFTRVLVIGVLKYCSFDVEIEWFE